MLVHMTKRTSAYEGKLFTVEHQPVPGRDKPYEFVRRIGAVTTFPITIEERLGRMQPSVVTIDNKRHGYGHFVRSLPAGNADGGFTQPEAPDKTALRELQEETGYGFPQGIVPNVSVFRLREVSNTIDYPRFFAIMRGVEYIGGERTSRYEEVAVNPTPLREYTHGLYELDRGETYPEINAAFARAGQALGRNSVDNWLLNPNPTLDTIVHQAFEPWLIAQPASV